VLHCSIFPAEAAVSVAVLFAALRFIATTSSAAEFKVLCAESTTKLVLYVEGDYDLLPPCSNGPLLRASLRIAALAGGQFVSVAVLIGSKVG
jgi:hypothetical protein